MIEAVDVRDIVQGATFASIPRALVSRVETTPTADQDGEDALSVLIVLNDTAADSITGDQALEALSKIRTALFDAGDTRFPFVSYATEDELTASADPES
jgi:hypothetical protein